MTATNHTEHYGLSQYTEDDRPTYTGDYNGDMSKIDTAIYAASQSGGLITVEHTADLTGDGTTAMPLGVVAGTAIKPVDNRWNTIDFNNFYTNGIYTFNCQAINGPTATWASGAFMVFRGFQTVMQVYFSNPFPTVKSQMAVRYAIVPNEHTAPVAKNWTAWKNIATMDDIPDVSALTSRITALESTVSQLTASTPA